MGGNGHRAAVVAFSRDGSQVLTGSDDNTAILRDSRASLLRIFSAHASDVTSAAFPRDGTKILRGSGGGTAVLRDISPRTELEIVREGAVNRWDLSELARGRGQGWVKPTLEVFR